MRKFSTYRSYSSSYRPFGSDDGYDYSRDNRDGYVDAQAKLDEQYREHLRFVEEMKKKEEKKT